MANEIERASRMPDLIELAAAIEAFHRQLHLLSLMVTEIAGTLNEDQRAILGETISRAVESYEPILLKAEVFKPAMHEATSVLALGYETTIAKIASAWKRSESL